MAFVQGSPVAGPGGIDPQGARMRQQLVPAPERIWALRNVANSMLRSTASSGGGGSSGSATPSAEEAVSMLQQASDLASDHYGKQSPGEHWVAARQPLRTVHGLLLHCSLSLLQHGLQLYISKS